ncbi:MAG: hypothetical protein EXR99_15630 [Gemmataceae bacterium]|nr:hypothetical protein [Gemmataceae bacterium]
MRRIDAALVGYVFATLFAAFAITYRYTLWLQRPPTQMYWKRGVWAFFRSPPAWKSTVRVARRLVSIFLLNRFIWRRSFSRGLSHSLILWGCLTASLITFPLVFGWVHFETLPGGFTFYQAFLFGFPLFSFRHESALGLFLFHGLVWSSLAS